MGVAEPPSSRLAPSKFESKIPRVQVRSINSSTNQFESRQRLTKFQGQNSRCGSLSARGETNERIKRAALRRAQISQTADKDARRMSAFQQQQQKFGFDLVYGEKDSNRDVYE